MGQFTDGFPAAAAGSLGNYGNSSADAGQGDIFGLGFAEPEGVPGAGRRHALALRERLWSVSSIADVRKCGKVPREVNLALREAPGGFRLTGLCTCHSVWVCPICAPEIRAARGMQIREAMLDRLAAGGGVTFGTGTLSHVKAHSLRGTYSLVVTSWNCVNTDYSVRRFREAHGYGGFVRTTETTYTDNGWHPHMHWLDFWERALVGGEWYEYENLVYLAWSRAVARQSDRKASADRGIKVLPVTDRDASALANYVTEIAPTSAAFEVTSISTKEARKGGLAPFEILAKVYGPGSKPWVDLWWEYEQATRGRRMLGASRGLLSRLGLTEDDPVPAELGKVVAFVTSEDWGRIRWFTNSGLAGVQAILEHAAKDGQVGVDAAVALLLGLSVDRAPSSLERGFWDREEDDF